MNFYFPLNTKIQSSFDPIQLHLELELPPIPVDDIVENDTKYEIIIVQIT